METKITELKTAQQIYNDLNIKDWENVDRLTLAARIILDLLPQPLRVSICIRILDRDLFGNPGND